MISLTAEQKTIEGIFCTTTEMYVIPAYQRPYSWGFDQFYELYRDLIGAYNDNEPYFLGNIIMARSNASVAIAFVPAVLLKEIKE